MKAQFIKRIIGFFVAAAIFMGIVRSLNYLYQSTDEQRYRLLWHSYYEDQGKIENLVLGSSHVFCGIDPRMLTELTEEYCFDMASPGQRMNGTFYLLREADHGNELKHVYIDMNYECNVVDISGKDPIDTVYYRNWQNTDYMRLSANKITYMLSIAGTDKWIEILLPFSRYRTKLGDWEYIKKTTADKREEDYLNYQYHDGASEYLGQGFWGSTEILEDGSRRYGQSRILRKQLIGDKSRGYIYRIIQYCQEREIPVTLFAAPINDLQLISTVNYDCYVDEVREIADEYKIPFYDFNLVREQYLPIQNGQYFRDMEHLNTAGAELFTQFFWQVMSQEESENTDYFCNSYEERLRESSPAVHGIYYRESEKYAETEMGYKNIWIASNRDSGMEYRIILTPEEGEQYTVQDFEENKKFTVPSDEHGICTIVWRMGETSDQVQTMEIDY